MRVTVDGFTAFEGMLHPGEPQSWVAQEIVIAETGNGAGCFVIVNGQNMGALGNRGQVSARGWIPTGEVEVPATTASAP